MLTNPSVPRISLADPENAPQPIKDALSELPVVNVFRTLANAEYLYPNFSARSQEVGVFTSVSEIYAWGSSYLYRLDLNGGTPGEPHQCFTLQTLFVSSMAVV